jgi:hypothetical protein
MLREFEKGVLGRINFVDRYINATNEFTRNSPTNYKLKSKDIIDSLRIGTLNFKHKSGSYFADVDRNKYKFRLLFDIKGGSILTYIWVLQEDKFVDNGLSHFAYLLNYFDIDGKMISQHFGLNSKEEFSTYVTKMISIFNDFINEFMNCDALGSGAA